MLNTPLISDLIFKGEVHEIKQIMAKSRELGMQTFDQHLFDLYDGGQISYEDALRNADSVNELRLMIKLNSKEAKAERRAGWDLAPEHRSERDARRSAMFRPLPYLYEQRGTLGFPPVNLPFLRSAAAPSLPVRKCGGNQGSVLTSVTERGGKHPVSLRFLSGGDLRSPIVVQG